jgi:hypothetical protein
VGALVLTITRGFDRLNRLQSISTASAEAGNIASFGYRVNSLGQREQADLAGGACWKCGYDGASLL